jgi:hypothetical protein
MLVRHINEGGSPMLGQLRKRLTYANVMSTLAVFLVLTTGTAWATHLVVNSSDVVDESLVSADLKNGAAVKTVDVMDASLTGTDVGQDSLTGADIKESTLGQVRTATMGGLGRSAANETCNPQSTTYDRCVEVQLNLPSPARVPLNGRLTPTNSGANRSLPRAGGGACNSRATWF